MTVPFPFSEFDIDYWEVPPVVDDDLKVGILITAWVGSGAEGLPPSRDAHQARLLPVGILAFLLAVVPVAGGDP